MRLIRRIAVTGKIRYAPPGLFHYQETGSAVPGGQFMFIETVKTAGRHPTKVHGCRSQPSDGHPSADQPGKNLQRSVWLIQVAVGKAGNQAGFSHGVPLAYLYDLIVERGAISFLGEKEFTDK